MKLPPFLRPNPSHGKDHPHNPALIEPDAYEGVTYEPTIFPNAPRKRQTTFQRCTACKQNNPYPQQVEGFEGLSLCCDAPIETISPRGLRSELGKVKQSKKEESSDYEEQRKAA